MTTQAGKICLLNPGPVTLSPRVRQALLRPDLCHREPHFAELLGDVRTRVGRVYPDATAYVPILLTGSGTAAVEAMVATLVPPEGKAVVAANGVYGERIAAMLQAQGKARELVRVPWTQAIDQAAVARALEDSSVTHVVAVHHETTTGRLNNLAAVGALCRARGIPLLIDAVSSFGAEAIDWEGWNVGACAATANKCLHGVPGISFVLVRHDLLTNGRSGSPSLYLDLVHQYEEQRSGFTPFTPAIQILYAFQEALIELEENGGWSQRHLRYRERSELVRRGLRGQGLSLLLDESDSSVALTAFSLPAGLAYADLYGKLRESGFVIYPGQQSLQSRIFRVAVMGDLSFEDLRGFVQATTRVLDGAEVSLTAGPA